MGTCLLLISAGYKVVCLPLGTYKTQGYIDPWFIWRSEEIEGTGLTRTGPACRLT